MFAKYSKGYQRPYRYSFAAQYGANQQGLRDKLLAQGKTLQDIINSWQMEHSDLFDIALKHTFKQGDVMLNFFYNLHSNLLASTWDPTLEINYLQNIGKAHVYGATFQSNFMPTKNLRLFFNPAVTFSNVLTNSIYKNSTYNIKSNQLPQTPRASLKTGATYRYLGHTLFFNLRYIGNSYSDIQNKERINSYTLADVSYTYQIKEQKLFRQLSIEAMVHNLFNTKYIAHVATADLLEDSPSYFVGALRSFMFGVRGSF
jgi:iron complex outermembrane receptor protein